MSFTRKKRKKPTDTEKYGDLPVSLRQGEIHPGMQASLKWGIGVAFFSILGIAAFTLLSFLGAPFVLTALINAWFAGSTIYLAGLTYGIINDLLAVRVNLPYFTLGHRSGQRGLIKSNDPNAVAVGWGILATYSLSLIAAAIFTVATLITGFIGIPFAGFVLPVIGIALPLVLGAGHWYAKHKAAQRAQQPNDLEYLKEIVTSPFSLGLDPYQTRRLAYYLKSPQDVNAWFSNSDRNSFGYMTLPLLGVGALTSLITLSAVHMFLPAILFSSAVAVFPPLALGLILATGIFAACAYLYVNRKKTIPNGFQLDYPDDSKAPPQRQLLPKAQNTASILPNLHKPEIKVSPPTSPKPSSSPTNIAKANPSPFRTMNSSSTLFGRKQKNFIRSIASAPPSPSLSKHK